MSPCDKLRMTGGEGVRVLVRWCVAAIALGCALAVPLRLSADAWAYAAYGALVVHGIDPWSHALRATDVAPLADPLLDAALRAWNGSLPRDVYGPLFTLPSAVVVAATRTLPPDGTVWTFRLLAAVGLMACIGLAYRTRPQLARLLAVHPVALWCAAEGHNDVFWLALVLAADRLHHNRARLAALIAAGSLKAIALVPLASFLIRNLCSRPRPAILAAIVLAGAYTPLGWSVIVHGLDHGVGPPRLSLLHAPALAAASGSPLPLIIAALLGTLALVGVMRALRDGDRLAGAVLLGWTLLPAPEPWYALWLLPVIGQAGRTPAARGLLAATFTGLAGYLQDAVPGTALNDPTFIGATMLALYALPFLIASLGQAPSPQPLPVPPTPPPLTAPSPAATTAPSPSATTTPSTQPAPTPTATPLPPTPAPSPSPAASATPALFGYVTQTQQPDTTIPRIVEVALNDRILHRGGMLLVRVTTSPEVTSLIARTMGYSIGIPQMSPGIFAGQQQLPGGIPSFLLNRNYQIEFVGTTSDGRQTSFAVPMRLQP